MSNLAIHAERELSIIGMGADSSGINKMMHDALLELLAVFSKQGHSGMSASYAIDLFAKLADFKPLSPVRGTQDEWNKPQDDVDTYQNNRCSACFKDGVKGRAHYLDAIVWRTPNSSYCGTAFLPSGEKIWSRQYVKFPFTPKTFFIDVEEKEIAPDDWEFWIKDPAQLDAVFEYYDKYEANKQNHRTRA